MIYITADTHGQTDFGKILYFLSAHRGLTKKDYMIIAGDFGGMKEEGEFATTLQMYADLPFTTLFVDGNHENFDLLDTYPIEIWNGGKIHRISSDIIHLMRGQVFEIEGKTFFAFGGATGADKCLRIEGYDWFPQEIPSREEYEEGVANLKKYHNTVDYIVTHTCDEKALWYPPLVTRVSHREVCPENLMFSHFEEIVSYKHWYFGHYHLDGDLTAKKTVLFQKILPLAQ